MNQLELVVRLQSTNTCPDGAELIPPKADAWSSNVSALWPQRISLHSTIRCWAELFLNELLHLHGSV